MASLDELDLRFRQYNAKYRIVTALHLKELQEEIEDLNQSGKININIYNNYLHRFQFKRPKENRNAQSVIIIAIPQRISIASFQLNDKKIKVVIPPTYIYRKSRKHCIDVLSKVFDNNSEISKAVLPLKLLAAHSGLGRYGRNNICYIDKMGSFARLEAFYIEYQFDRDNWQDKEMLHQCKGCYRCVKNCPTKCIKNDDFVIDAGRCITYFNETEGDFPKELNPKAHNALVGCMKCQVVCPVNHSFLKEKTIVETFTKEETDLILSNEPKVSSHLTRKLKQLDMDEYQTVLARNLKALIKSCILGYYFT